LIIRGERYGKEEKEGRATCRTISTTSSIPIDNLKTRDKINTFPFFVFIFSLVKCFLILYKKRKEKKMFLRFIVLAVHQSIAQGLLG
jgi:hypothetical protein